MVDSVVNGLDRLRKDLRSNYDIMKNSNFVSSNRICRMFAIVEGPINSALILVSYC